MLGLDALSSAAYGPEAALTVLIPLGAAGTRFITPLGALIVAVLLIVFVSYRQTIFVVVPAGSWNKITQNGLKFALRLSAVVHVVQVKTETDSVEDLSDNWELLIGSRARTEGIVEPKLVVLTSEYRRFFKPLVDYVLKLEHDNPERDVVVVIPDVILSHWYEGLLHNNRGAFLRSLLRARGGPRVVVVDVPFRIND